MTSAEPSRKPIRVLVIDDHDLFRTGLASLLSAEDDIEIVAQASGGRMGVRLAAELRPDVVLIDLSMPDMTGIEATREIVRDRPETRVLVLTVSTAEADVNSVLHAGAIGFLAKDAAIDSVVGAVRAAADGDTWLSPAAARVVLGQVRTAAVQRPPRISRIDQLSSRELEVLRLIAAGKENSEIAAELHISPRTAKNHVSSILTKLELPSRVQAAVYAVREGVS